MDDISESLKKSNRRSYRKTIEFIDQFYSQNPKLLQKEVETTRRKEKARNKTPIVNFDQLGRRFCNKLDMQLYNKQIFGFPNEPRLKMKEKFSSREFK